MLDLKSKHTFICALPIFLLGLVACTCDTDDVMPGTDLPIRWSVQSESLQTSRAFVENSAALQTACSNGGQAIGIWSAYQSDGGDFREHALGTEGDAALTYTTGEGWTYGEKPACWVLDAVYYFNAYFPKEGGMTGITHTTTSITGTYNTLTSQQDLMVHTTTVDTGVENFQGQPVALEMKHALSSLMFTVQLEEGSNATKKLKSLSLDNALAVQGVLNYSGGALAIDNWTLQPGSGNYAWSNDGVAFTATTAATAFTTPEGTTTTTGSKYCNNGGHVLIIPQTCTKAPCITIVTDTESYENVSLGTTRFEPGKVYAYNIVVKDNEVDVTLGIKPWNLKESSYDITF